MHELRDSSYAKRDGEPPGKRPLCTASDVPQQQRKDAGEDTDSRIQHLVQIGIVASPDRKQAHPDDAEDE